VDYAVRGENVGGHSKGTLGGTARGQFLRHFIAAYVGPWACWTALGFLKWFRFFWGMCALTIIFVENFRYFAAPMEYGLVTRNDLS
jgi:hypothetical protein